MTNRALKLRLILITIIVGVLLAVSLFEFWWKASSGTTFISSNATLLALLFAAYMAYLFQQRSKSVDDLRRWWNEIAQAKSKIFVYCDKHSPSEDDYLEAFSKLSTAMDTLRLIYCNVGRTKNNPRGFYPFEQVRDIVDIMRSIAPERNDSIEERKVAKTAIDLIFQSLRHAIQEEAGATPPDKPTLYESEHRMEYKKRVERLTGIDIEIIRYQNKTF